MKANEKRFDLIFGYLNLMLNVLNAIVFLFVKKYI